LAPEALLCESWEGVFCEPQYAKKIALLAYDEAHVIAKWYQHYFLSFAMQNIFCIFNI
jgi:hypothetical protein